MKRLYSLILIVVGAVAASAISLPTRMPDLSSVPLVPSVESMQHAAEFDKYDKAAAKCARWLLSISTDEDVDADDTHNEASEFLLAWMDMTDKIHVELGREVGPLMESREILVAYLAGAALYAIENHTPVYDYSMQLHSLSVAISYYMSNRPRLGQLGGMELLAKLRDSGKLEYYLTDIVPMLAQPLAQQDNMTK